MKDFFCHLKLRKNDTAFAVASFFVSIVVFGLCLPCVVFGGPFFEDWQKVSDSQNRCGGVYLPPLFESVLEGEEPVLSVVADSTALELGGLAKLKGDVVLRYGEKEIRAEALTLKQSPKAHALEGLVATEGLLYTEPTFRVGGKAATFDGATETLRVQNAEFRYYPKHARGGAKEVVVHGNQNIDLKKSTYTTCAPDKTTWELSAKDIYLYPQKGRGVAQDVVFRVRDLPVVYLPYLDFPLDARRKSGFLFPHFGTTSRSGSELSVPYYWNLAPNYDMTFTPRVLTDRGMDFQTHFRYLTSHSDGALQVNILPNDREYRDFRRENLQSPPSELLSSDPRITALTKGNHRFAVAFDHHAHYLPHWLFDINYHYVGDDNYFVDLGNDLNLENTARLLQQGQLQYRGRSWTHLWRFQEHQVLHPLSGPEYEEEYRRQPQWAFHASVPNALGGFAYELDGEFAHFAHRGSVLTGLPFTEGQRYHLRPGLSLPFVSAQGYFIPRLQWDFLAYDLSLGAKDTLQQRPDSVFRTIPLWDIDSGLFFERNAKWGKTALLQTLEPRLYYLYVPFRDQNHYPNFDSGVMDFSFHQMFRDNVFSGRDRIKDLHQLSLSLTSRWLDAATGKENLRLSLGETFYLSDRRVTLCDSALDKNCQRLEDPNFDKPFSPFVGELATHLTDYWHFLGTLEWDLNLQRNEKTMLSAYYQNGQNKILNLSYYWLKVDPAQTDFQVGRVHSLEQADVSFIWQVMGHWHILGRYLYDFESTRAVDILGGLEYDGCCSALQFVFSRYLKPNDGTMPREYATGFFFQVLFKGLSSVGLNNADDKLSKKIPGYARFRARQSMV